MKIPSIKQIKDRRNEGFTLVEILVVIGVIAVLLAVALIAINPNQHFIDSRNAQRQNNVTAIMDAIYAYQAANEGSLPEALQGEIETPTIIGDDDTEGEIDLCSALVPAYIADLPGDPESGETQGDTCADGDYSTGYTILKSESNRFTIAAPDAEGDATISITR